MVTLEKIFHILACWPIPPTYMARYRVTEKPRTIIELSMKSVIRTMVLHQFTAGQEAPQFQCPTCPHDGSFNQKSIIISISILSSNNVTTIQKKYYSCNLFLFPVYRDTVVSILLPFGDHRFRNSIPSTHTTTTFYTFPCWSFVGFL